MKIHLFLLWTCGHAASLASSLVEVGWSTGTGDTIYHVYIYTAGCGHIYLISCCMQWKLTRFKVQLTLLLLLYDFPLLCCTWICSSYYVWKSWRQSHRKENRNSILALQTPPPPLTPHLSPFISLTASRGMWKSYCQNALCLAQWSIVSALSSSGQNESGVAVHDDRIYVVGGYSIWTNEPLACIQVRDVTVVTPQSDQINWCEFYW